MSSIRGPAGGPPGALTGQVKFLVDAQLPPALALWLREAGYEAEHVESIELLHASDSVIWAQALRDGLVIVTKDEDFAARSAQAARAPVIVWLRVGNATNVVLRAWFEPRLPGIVTFLQGGSRLVEVI